MPVVRIDGAMAEQAVEMGTMSRWRDLRYHSPAHNRTLKEKGAILGKEIVVQPYLVEGLALARDREARCFGRSLGKRPGNGCGGFGPGIHGRVWISRGPRWEPVPHQPRLCKLRLRHF